MNNQRTSSQQFFQIMALSLAAMFIYNNFFGGKKPVTPARPAATLAQVFAGLDPAQPPLLTKAQAPAEILKLDAQIKANESDSLASWSRLRAGLVQQYVMKNTKAAVARYDEVIHQNGHDDISAQAAWQKGDLLWQESTKGGKASPESAWALETLMQRGRASKAFLDLSIFRAAQPAADATTPPAAWEAKKIGELYGTANNRDGRGILERIDAYYSTTLLHKIFSATVKALGDNPRYSYGLAILVFALFTRVLLQPLNKKQYDSMRGMAIIAPEMKKVQDKYKNKKDQESQMKMMSEIRALQKSHGVNPMLGCGLAAVQIPVFFYVVSPFIHHFEARMELVGASFLWIDGLARPDIPLLVLYALSQFASMRLSSTPPADEQQRQMQLMMLFFPFAVPFFLLAWPSAFTLYWMAFNILSMFFQYRMMKSADPTKRFWHQLIGQPLIPKIPEGSAAEAAAAGAVPSRPASGHSALREDKVKTIVANNLANGTSNGKSKTPYAASEALNGTSKNGSANGSGIVRTKRRGKKK